MKTIFTKNNTLTTYFQRYYTLMFIIFYLDIQFVIPNTLNVGKLGNEDFSKIQSAIDFATSGDTIIVSKGIYKEVLDIYGKGLTIKSRAGPYTTLLLGTKKRYGNNYIIDINNKYPHDPYGDRIVKIEGFTLLKSNAGIKCKSSVLILENNIFLDIGTIYSAVQTDSTLTVENCIFKYNDEAINVLSGECIVRNSVFEKNDIGFNSIDLRLSNGNGSIPTLWNNLFIRNNVAVQNDATLINNTLAFNEVGIRDMMAQRLVIMNSIFYNNGNDLIYNRGVGKNIQVSYSRVISEPGVGNVTKDPLFINEKLFILRKDSPCIDSGSPNPENNDHDGSRNDMGIYGGPHSNLLLFQN